MTRTDRLMTAITTEVERHRVSIDADEALQKVTVIVKLNDGGYPRAVWLDRESMVDLTTRRVPT